MNRRGIKRRCPKNNGNINADTILILYWIGHTEVKLEGTPAQVLRMKKPTIGKDAERNSVNQPDHLTIIIILGTFSNLQSYCRFKFNTQYHPS